jgi:hypothetical protein
MITRQNNNAYHPSSVVLLTSTSIDDNHQNKNTDNFFESPSFPIDSAQLNANKAIHFDLNEIGSLMDWNAIINSNSKYSDRINVYYQMRMIFGGEQHSSFAVTSKVQQFEIALFELVSYPCYTQIRSYLELNNANEERTREILFAELATKLYYALFYSFDHDQEQEQEEQKQDSKHHLATQLLFDAHICNMCDHPRFSLDWLRSLFEMNVQIKAQYLTIKVVFANNAHSISNAKLKQIFSEAKLSACISVAGLSQKQQRKLRKTLFKQITFNDEFAVVPFDMVTNAMIDFGVQ